MKIAIATVQIPFVAGGAELHAQNLRRELIRAGHEAEIITMPFSDYPPYLLENQIVASRLMDLRTSWGGNIDLCIGMKFPAYFFPHPNKVIWVLHQYRHAYDLFNTEYSFLKDDPQGRKIQSLIRQADQTYLKEAKRLYANSRNVAGRMAYYNGIISQPLYHPCPDMEDFYCAGDEGYILMPSRINQTKRQDLAIEALRYTRENIRLVILGRPDNDAVLEKLNSKIREYGAEDKVRFIGYVSQREKLSLYAKARAVLFIPKDEDYGYITLEAMAASKPVITVRDSGGPLEFVLDEETGLITQPEPQALAEAMDELTRSATLAAEMGRAGKQRLTDMDITWDHVVKELTRE